MAQCEWAKELEYQPIWPYHLPTLSPNRESPQAGHAFCLKVSFPIYKMVEIRVYPHKVKRFSKI